jgi:hypothetical protein
MQRVLGFVGETWADPSPAENIFELWKGPMQLDALSDPTGPWEQDLSPEVVQRIEGVAGVTMRQMGYTVTTVNQQPPFAPALPTNNVDD